MTYAAAMKELKAAGTPQNRKVYAKHGVSGDMFGVSFANLKAMAKKIKVDHDLAVRLWESENPDARILATMVAEPTKLAAATAEAWSKQLDNYVIADAFCGMAAKAKFARQKADKWGKAKGDFVGQAGWCLVTHLAMHDESCPDDYFAAKLDIIEQEIHNRKNRTRHAMNMALCGIGIARPKLRKRAFAVAKHIGKVEVDHGDTSCKTPDATAYIHRAVDRKK